MPIANANLSLSSDLNLQRLDQHHINSHPLFLKTVMRARGELARAAEMGGRDMWFVVLAFWIAVIIALFSWWRNLKSDELARPMDWEPSTADERRRGYPPNRRDIGTRAKWVHRIGKALVFGPLLVIAIPVPFLAWILFFVPCGHASGCPAQLAAGLVLMSLVPTLFVVGIVVFFWVMAARTAKMEDDRKRQDAEQSSSHPDE